VIAYIPVLSNPSLPSDAVWRCLPDLDATEALGRALVPMLLPGALVALEGPLGSGKTALVRAMLRSWGFTGRVKSPSYTLVEHYDFDGFDVCHFDFYRFNEVLEADQAGFREHFNDHTICIVEWPDRAERWLPPADLKVQWFPVDEGRVVSLYSQKGLVISKDLPGIPHQEIQYGA
jgi:tRNA threonylcarbamoyladenosine biosynthesis protein TsaE